MGWGWGVGAGQKSAKAVEKGEEEIAISHPGFRTEDSSCKAQMPYSLKQSKLEEEAAAVIYSVTQHHPNRRAEGGIAATTSAGPRDTQGAKRLVSTGHNNLLLLACHLRQIKQLPSISVPA